MNDDVLSTKSKILQTAIDIFGTKGEVTIREITEGAGVNVAAINYYYGNKDNLLKEVENHYSDLLYKMQYEVLVCKDLPHREKLLRWAKSLIEFIFRFPALVKLIVSLSNTDKNYNPILIKKIYSNIEIKDRIENIIKESTGLMDKKLLGYKYLQVFSSILGPVIGRLVANTFEKDDNIFDLNTSEELEEYLKIVIDSILG